MSKQQLVNSALDSDDKQYCINVYTGGAASLLLWGAKGAKEVALPITVGPKKGGEKGPRGRL